MERCLPCVLGAIILDSKQVYLAAHFEKSRRRTSADHFRQTLLRDLRTTFSLITDGTLWIEIRGHDEGFLVVVAVCDDRSDNVFDPFSDAMGAQVVEKQYVAFHG